MPNHIRRNFKASKQNYNNDMKRITVVLSMLLFVGISFADTQKVPSYEAIPLQVSITDPTLDHEPVRLSPVRIPTIYLDDHLLIFSTPCDNSILTIINENGNTEFSVTIPGRSSTLLLPKYLSGDYCIQIMCGHFRFRGYIVL